MNEQFRREILSFIAPLGIATGAALIVNSFEVFERLHWIAGIHEAFTLAFALCLALLYIAAQKTLRLRREIVRRRQAEEAARLLARHDSLTGLPNRRVLLERLEDALSVTSAAAPREFALLLIDLDRFKPVNDLHGHPAGDAVLCEVAKRLTAGVPAGGMVARLGGDEFAAVFESEPGEEMTMRVAQRIITSVGTVFRWNNFELVVGATIGIGICPYDGSDPEALIRAADIALYQAKRDGRGRFHFFEQGMDEELQARAQLEADLRRSIMTGEIEPHYQPLVRLPGEAVIGFEILARWHHPARGNVPPSLFIPIAEDVGLIAELTYHVLRQACTDAKAWPSHIILSLNIAPSQLKDRRLPERVLGILTEMGFAPGRLEIELTENALLDNLEVARLVLSSLRNLGVRIVLDDFGTGYSSLNHLRELQFDKIKIDRSFVQTMQDQNESRKIVGAILSLGRSLGLPITAEGIEHEEHIAWLAQHGCTYGQGFLFGQPVPAREVLAFLAVGAARDARRTA